MTCWALIPVKAVGEGKSRLAGVLDPQARTDLVRAMLAHVANTARASPEIEHVCLVGPSRHGLGAEVELLSDPGDCLNAALQAALQQIADATPLRLIVIAADLPRVTQDDFAQLAKLDGDMIGLAPDRHGTGTNAISLPLPGAADFRFAFGAGSFARHLAEAERLQLRVETIRSDGLARDIDEPGDLPDAGRLFSPQRWSEPSGSP